MAVHLQFHRLALKTAQATSRYEFKSGLNVLTGSYKTGKSSMLELIKFALGAKNAKLMTKIEENLQNVSLDVTIGMDRLNFSRAIGQNQITVTRADGSTDRWTATSGKIPRSGIEILKLLKFPIARLSKNSETGSEPLTFFDLFRYVYLPQDDVNSSVAGHADPFLNRKRRAIFELAYGLSDERIRELEVDAAALGRAQGEAKLEAETVRRFLFNVGAPHEADLAVEEAEARSDLVEAERRLEEAKRMAGAEISADQEGLRKRISTLRTATADAEAERTLAQVAVDRGRALLAQLELDALRAQREAEAHNSISGLEFAVCPRCLQSVSGRDLDPGLCLLCVQPQPSRSGSKRRSDHEASVNRLLAQKEEARILLKQDEDYLTEWGNQVNRLREQLTEAAGDLERQADPRQIFPSIDQASEAAADRERARARLRDIERFRDQWEQYEGLESRVRRFVQQLEANRSQQVYERRRLEENKYRIVELGEIFDEEIRELRFTGYQEAGLDPQTYLPVINGDSFDRLSVSGASKTLANDAYYLANLAYSLSSSEYLMPDVLLLDSPRTSLGNTPDDIAAGQRLYERMYRLSLAYPRCQIIVADNGLPPLERELSKSMNLITLTYSKPLLQDVPHPGREAVMEMEQSEAGRRRR
ncbi:AAA family ATPase [Micromonospora sp. NPDC001898]|uniref:AAA family ATPase n=1 Tax=Micromonospora sp. NPDC001898 TaxID=3364221 RepID=UPI0036AC921A